ncbi:MAG: uroporphyrinogen decarboxylase family protein [Planctomycetota bacterium]
METYTDIFKSFLQVAAGKEKDKTTTALIIDSPWLPGYTGTDSIGFFFNIEKFCQAYENAVNDLPNTAFIPGCWFEFGMAAEPSGWGIRIQWNKTSPPSVHHHPGGLAYLVDAEIPNPETDGLMPLILKNYEQYYDVLPIKPQIAAARGPLATASHLMGTTEFLMATQCVPDQTQKLLEKTTDMCINWLKAQLNRMPDAKAILVLDDIVGLLDPLTSEKMALPCLRRIFDNFSDLLTIYHNDAPNKSMLAGLAQTGMNVFNFSHTFDPVKVRQALGKDIVLMGNIAPLNTLVSGSAEQVKQETLKLLDDFDKISPIIISAGGGVSPGTPIENLKAMENAVINSDYFKKG